MADIETLCKNMVADANAKFAAYEKKSKTANTMRLFLSQYEKSLKRSAEDQAAEVLAGRSWTCNSSHMADAARHVGLLLNKKAMFDLRKFKKDSEDDYSEFVDVYDAAMKKQGLRNYKGGAGFDPLGPDAYHMELKDSRLPANSPEVLKCMEVYAEATRKNDAKRNQKFEDESSVKKYLEDYEKKME
jgi:hypothetical protein